MDEKVIDEKVREAKREYQREWRKKNPEKAAAIYRRYWLKKVAQIIEQEKASNDGTEN